jgi:hypothetical protein
VLQSPRTPQVELSRCTATCNFPSALKLILFPASALTLFRLPFAAKTAKSKSKSVFRPCYQVSDAEKRAEKLLPVLEPVLAFPLEILAEVSSSNLAPSETPLTLHLRSDLHSLDPEDMRNLCRTPCWRNFLLSPRARTIWAAVRRCAGLPSLTGLSEVKFAVLVFRRACWVSICLSSGGNAVDP